VLAECSGGHSVETVQVWQLFGQQVDSPTDHLQAGSCGGAVENRDTQQPRSVGARLHAIGAEKLPGPGRHSAGLCRS